MARWAAGLHWSYSGRAWCGLIAILADGRSLVRHELTWHKRTPEHAAAELRDFTADRKIDLDYCVAQPDLWPNDKKKRFGETVSETFALAGIPMQKADDDRFNGWSRLRSWLHVRTFEIERADGIDRFESPSLIIHPDCQYLIRTLPVLVSAGEDTPDDVLEVPEDFAANGLRYYAMSRPLPEIRVIEELPPDAIGHDVEAIRRELRRR